MGILDAPAVGLKKFKSTIGNPSQLISVLRRNRQDASIVLTGDSTGNETGEWFYLTMLWLIAKFPAYTVTYRLWDDATQTYGSVSTLQTGTGPRTLAIYNASHPGAGYDYSFQNGNTPRFLAIFPVTPTTIITSYGYNSGTTTYRTETTELARWITGNFPTSEVIMVAQPPKATADPDSANSVLRSADVRAVALQNGYGLIDATQVFLDYGNFDTLIMGDYIHPNAQGMALWAEEAKKIFDPETPAVRPRTTGPVIDRIFVDATRFIPSTGTPNLDTSAAGVPKYNLDPDVAEAIVAVADIPPTWATANVWLYWSTPGTSTAGVVWYVDQQALAGQMAAPVSGATPSGFTNGNKQWLASFATAGTVRVVKVLASTRLTAGRPLVFRVRRDAVDAQDTYTLDGWVYGIMIERAS